MNSNKKLYILVAVLVVLLAVTIGLIVALRPGSDATGTPDVQGQQTVEPSAAPSAEPTAEPAADDPLAGLSEEEIGALAMAEESHEEGESEAEAAD